jgi:pSer/pThr/pTyr-binding forkhead associated (FHA) protein/CheY-like chemotaxis protein
VSEGPREPPMPNDRGAGLLKANPDAPKVLCVDDEPDVLRGLKRILGTEFRIVTADDPITALTLLEHDHDFSVVIADVRMPRMDGGEFLTRAKTLSPMTTRLALTGCVEWDPADTHPSDIFERLTKPCPVDRLHASVMAAAKQHSLLTSLPEPLKRLCTSISTTHGGSLEDVGYGATSIAAPSSDISLIGGLGEFSPGRRIALRMFDRDIELLPGITVLGRSKMCNIVINDPRISRRHACFSYNGREVTVEDVSSTNGLLVNGRPIQGVHRLSINDRLTIGPLTADVCGMSEQNTSFEPTMRLSPIETGVRAERQGPPLPGALPIVMGVAEKALFLGENRHAERIVRPLLDNLLWRYEDGQIGSRDELDAAVGFALRLAEASGSGEWIDYVFRLYTALRHPLPPAVIERLYALLRTTTGVSVVLFRHYLAALRTIATRLGPADQFLVKRTQGLEHLISQQLVP